MNSLRQIIRYNKDYNFNTKFSIFQSHNMRYDERCLKLARNKIDDGGRKSFVVIEIVDGCVKYCYNVSCFKLKSNRKHNVREMSNLSTQ